MQYGNTSGASAAVQWVRCCFLQGRPVSELQFQVPASLPSIRFQANAPAVGQRQPRCRYVFKDLFFPRGLKFIANCRGRDRFPT